MTESDDSRLARAIGGEAEALCELLERYGSEVRRHVAGQISKRHQSAFDVDDVMQVTYLEAFLRIRAFQPQGNESFPTWLRRIAESNRRAAETELEQAAHPSREKPIHRARGADGHVSVLAALGYTGRSGSGVAAQDGGRELLERAMAMLPPDYAMVVRYCGLQAYSASKAAASMGRSVGAVYMLRSRAYARLKEILGPESRFFSETQ